MATQRPFLKELVVRALAADPIVALTSRSAGWATLFMMHRLSLPEIGVVGHDPAALRQTLAWLRAHKYEILDLETLYRRLLGEGGTLQRAVAFTLDDGYLEQSEVAGPIFAEFDAPSTTFLATGFVDRDLWLWWDQVEYILDHAKGSRLSVEVGSQRFQLDLTSPGTRLHSHGQVCEACKRIPEQDKAGVIARLAALADVDLPATAPAKFAPMSWDQARAAEKKGMRFGPQTVTHPILSMTEPQQSRLEIERSWSRVREEMKQPMPVFCYPNGTPNDFGPREIAVVQELGMIGAVAGTAGFAEARGASEDGARYRVPRFPYGDSLPGNIQFVSGVERLKCTVRRMVGAT
jgi:peptidoglycan/xylan/chitin deacetylase (PgdA/CDA1 family)